jgi:hypothetical protein
MLQERRRSWAKAGVIEAPRVKLLNGFFNTIEKPTSLPTATYIIDWMGLEKVSCTGVGQGTVTNYSETPAEPVFLAIADFPMLPPDPTRRRLQHLRDFEATAGLQYPLSALHEQRCRHPCKTRFRLAGSAFAGRASNPLGHVEKFQVISILLSRTCPDASWVHVRRNFYKLATPGPAPIASEALQRAFTHCMRSRRTSQSRYRRAIAAGLPKARPQSRGLRTSLTSMKVTAHVAQNTSGRSSAIDGRTTRHRGYAVSQRIRKRIEEAFGWIKTIAGQEKSRFRGRDRVGWAFTFAAAAYNLVRLPKVIAEAC